MGPRRLPILALAASCGLSLCACAHPTTKSTPPPAKESIVIAATESTSTPSPTLSAEEIGRRFLKLVEGLKSRSDLTEERIGQVIDVPLVPNEGRWWYGYKQDLTDGWFFTFDFIPKSPQRLPSAGLTFDHKGDRYADMTPICIPNEDYHSALKAMGFREAPTYGDLGEMIDWRYYRDDIVISIVSHPQTRKLDGKEYRACVKSIGLLN